TGSPGSRSTGHAFVESLVQPGAKAIFRAMRTAIAPRPSHPAAPMESATVRPAATADLEALIALEHEAFSIDRISPRSFRRFLVSANAALLVAEVDGRVAGYALVLFHASHAIARLYSIAASPRLAGRRIGVTLLDAAEEAAVARGSPRLRLEVHERNAAAIALYRKSGYREVGPHPHYYENRGHALRVGKPLQPRPAPVTAAPPHFHQP